MLEELVEPSFADDQKQFVFYFVGELDTPELEAAAPSGHFFFLHGIHDFAELIHFFRRIFFGGTSFETVQFFVVVIFYLFAYGGQQAFFFTNLVLSATFAVYRNYFRFFLQLAFVYFLLYVFVVKVTGYESEYDYSNKNQY